MVGRLVIKVIIDIQGTKKQKILNLIVSTIFSIVYIISISKRIGSEQYLIKWQDTANNALDEAYHMGFQVEKGGAARFGALCYGE